MTKIKDTQNSTAEIADYGWGKVPFRPAWDLWEKASRAPSLAEIAAIGAAFTHVIPGSTKQTLWSSTARVESLRIGK